MTKTLSDTAKRLMEDSRFREAKKDNDTVRLWENYREQALLWRALALFQIPATVLAIAAALYFGFKQEIILNVPRMPEPGQYSATEIPDNEFLSFGESYINLVATYQNHTAEKQFLAAAEMLVEPVLSRFEDEMLSKELSTIKDNRRTQVLYIRPDKTRLDRGEEMRGFVRMTVIGERQKTISGRPLAPTPYRYVLTMKTIPKNVKYNKYGIVIVGVEAEEISEDEAGF